MSSPQLKSKEYNIIDTLGAGTFGVVNKIKTIDEKFYALKQIDLKKGCSHLEECKKEYNLLKKGFKNVVKSYGSYHDEDREIYFFSMEYFSKNLKNLVENAMKNKQKLSFEQYFPIFLDVVSGLRNLFIEGKTIHRDIKPENILINEIGRASIADVGVAKTFESISLHLTKIFSELTTVSGTERWMPPEVLTLQINKKELNESNSLKLDQTKFDIFSLGLISLYVLDTQDFLKYDDLNIERRSLEKYLREFRKKNIVPKFFFYILKCMVSFESTTRPDIDELLEDIINEYQESKFSELSKPNESFSDSNRITAPQIKLKSALKDPDISASLNKLKVKSMTECKLDLHDNKNLDDEVLNSFTKEIMCLDNLKNLSVGFGQTSLTDKGLSALADCIKSLKDLEFLHLGLVSISNVTDQGIKALSESTKTLSKLKSLKFFFGSNSQIKDLSLVYISNALQALKNLQELVISINETAITDEGFYKLVNALSHVEKLKLLSIFCNENIGVTNLSIEAVEKMARAHNSLKKLELRLSGTKVTEVTAKRLQGILLEKSQSGKCLEYCLINI